MDGVGTGAPLVSGHPRLAVDTVGVIAVLLGLVEMFVCGAAYGWQLGTWLLPALGVEYAVVGWFVWRRRPANLMGPIMVLGALAWYASGMKTIGVQPLTAIGFIVNSLPLAVAMHLLHAFPSGRLRGASRAIVPATYFVSLVLEIPTYLFVQLPPPINVPFAVDNPGLAQRGEQVQNVCGLMVFAATAVVLFMRLRALDPARRRVTGPLLAFGLFAIIFQPFALHLLPKLGPSIFATQVVQIVMLAGIPLAFALCLLLGGYGRTGEIHELGVWLGSGPASRSDLASALRRTLGDPTLELWFWVRGEYVDAQGRPVLLRSSEDRGLVEVELTGDRIGAISFDATLLADRRAVETAGRVIALAVDRERLTAELLAARSSLRTTLSRVVESADTERRRIARDLHDGLQSRLVLLGMGAFQVEHDPTASPSVTQATRELRVGLDAGVDELRRLVAGVMPATLLERGLYAATEDFVTALPLRTSLDISGSGQDLPAAVESAAYFVVTEAVTNTLKHANAKELSVSLGRIGDSLHIAIADDGVGGADGALRGGLAGLADRVGALGGRFEVESIPGRGTRLFAEVPCGSS